MDEFPEFFERAELESSAIRHAIRDKDFGALRSAINKYAGDRWINSMNQNRALRAQADELGIEFRPGRSSIPIPKIRTKRIKRALKRQTIEIRGRSLPSFVI